jgi:SAM-dependent methyltransferase
MKKAQKAIGLKDVQAVYGGPEGDLWELIMGEQIHFGGLTSSMNLAERARIGAGMTGVDLCCCTGAGMRFLVRFRNVAKMYGVDATLRTVERGRQRCKDQGVADKVEFKLADVTDSGLPAGSVDFVWGEDAWCYVVDKEKLIAEAARLVKSGGVIAFTDWVEGKGLSDQEAERYLAFMKFPSIQDLAGYRALLEAHGCTVEVAEDTGRFGPCVDLYLNMLGMQLTYDALRIIGFDMEMMKGLEGEMKFMQGLAHAGKIAQGMLVARKK